MIKDYTMGYIQTFRKSLNL